MDSLIKKCEEVIDCDLTKWAVLNISEKFVIPPQDEKFSQIDMRNFYKKCDKV